MKWLVTGGCGFLGSNIADEALAQGDEVVVLDNLSRIGSAENLAWMRKRHGTGWRFVEADVRDPDAIERLVAEFVPDVVAHLAGQVAMTTSLSNPRLDFETNALGSLNVLEAVRCHHPQAIVLYSSSNKVYGDLEHLRYEETETRFELPDFPDGLDETLQLDFASPYGCSKGCADQYMRDFARCFGLRTMIFRHSSMYGGRQFATHDQGWVGWFCRLAVETRRGLTNQPLGISGTGKQVRDLLHADDMRRLYRAAARHEGAWGLALNVGGGMANSLSLLELFEMLAERIGRSLDVVAGPPRQSDQKVFVADISRAVAVLGWAPTVSAAEGVTSMLDWSEALLDDLVDC